MNNQFHYLTPKQFLKLHPTAKEELNGAAILRYFPAPETKIPTPNPQRTIQFVISTGAVDRDGDTISPGGWDFADYLKNPVVLWCHDYDDPPVGKTLSLSVTGNAVEAVAQFATADEYPFADTIYRLYLGGYLRAVSVGFDPDEWNYIEDDIRRGIDFMRQSLLEYSCCPVPSNPEALAKARHDKINTKLLFQWAELQCDKAQGGFVRMGKIFVPKEAMEALAKMADPSESVAGAVGEITVDALEAGQDAAEGINASEPNDNATSGNVGGDKAIDAGDASVKSGAIPVHDTMTVNTDYVADDHVNRIPADAAAAVLRKVFAWCNPAGDPNSEASYKLPHHQVGATGKPGAANVKQCRKIVDMINGDDDEDHGVPGEDCGPVYKHCRKHIEAHGLECPPMKSRALPEPELPATEPESPDDHFVKCAVAAADTAWQDSADPLAHHASGGAVVWAGLCRAMKTLMERGGAAEDYEHLARHYRDNFDTEPPQLRHVECCVLKNFPDLFDFDEATGKLVTITEQDRAMKTTLAAAARAAEMLRDALPAAEASGMAESFSAALDILESKCDNCGHKHATAADGSSGIPVELVADWIKNQGADLLRQVFRDEIGKATGRVD